MLAVARPLPTLESPVNEAENPESKLLLLIALLVLLRLRSSWMNEFIAAMESVGGDAGEQVLLLRLVEDEEVANWGSTALGDSNGASCYGHCWNNCIGCLV